MGQQTLLVCSGGGHLKQLFTLTEQLGIPAESQFWVTFDNALSRSLLSDRAHVFSAFAAPRDLYNVLKIRRLATSILSHTPFDKAISTGSAPAVAFLPVAAKRGIPSYYIESAARSSGPSLSGRILQRNPSIHTYTQYPGWASDRWLYRGSIFDAFAPSDDVIPITPRTAVVSVGTQQGFNFNRFFRRVGPLLADYDEVLWQTGPENVAQFGIPGRANVPHAELAQAVADADVVIAHSGTGAALTAIEQGKFPILVPRLARYHEHVDDHQIQIGAELERRGLAIMRHADELTSTDLALAASRRNRTSQAASFVLD